MIKEPLKYLKIDSWESIGDHLVDIGKTIGSFVLYILKTSLTVRKRFFRQMNRICSFRTFVPVDRP